MSPEDLRARVAAVLPEVVALRHDLHAHPELSGSEERTAAVVSAHLERAGIPHETGVGGGHGILATIEGRAGNGPGERRPRTFCLRGDMDALPIHEESAAPYRSTVPGVMHACGHDGHTAGLMGAALVLHSLQGELPGRVRLIFQPAEETVRGAEVIIAAGAVEDVDAILMLHGWPDHGVGQIAVRSGPAMASSDSFWLGIEGRGGHAAYPHDTVDPVLVGAEIIVALQTLVAREVSPLQPAVVSVTTFHAGTARNVIPDKAELSGTVRTLDPALRERMPALIERVIAGVCQALRAGYAFRYTWGTPALINDPGITDLVRAVGRDLLGPENVVELTEPTMGAEDFAYYLQRVPGAMFRLGTGCPHRLHTPGYDFGDAPLAHGIALLVEATRRFLSDLPRRP